MAAGSASPIGPVAVVGPTGYTGGLVVGELRRRGARICLIGRDAGRLEAVAARHGGGLDVRAVAHWERRDLADALEGTAAVIACAGPFLLAGRPVVEAAVDAAVPYCDSTGEQPFIREVYERLDAGAAGAGVALVPACGFDYLPGDLGAAIAATGLAAPLRRIDVVYAVERADTSVGTRRSAVGVMTHPGMQWAGGVLRQERLGARRRAVTTAFGRVTGGSIPGGEPLMVPRHLDVDTVIGYLATPGRLSPASPGVAALPALTRVPGVAGLLARAASRGPVGPDAAQRRARVACVVQAEGADGRRRAVRIEGADAYGFTATSLGEMAFRMADGRIDATGARSPAEVVEPRGFLEATGLRVVEVDPE